MDEFFAELADAESFEFAAYSKSVSRTLHIDALSHNYIRVSVKLATKDDIEEVFRVFDRNYDQYRLKNEEMPRVSPFKAKLGKSKSYYKTKFSPEVIREAYTLFKSKAKIDDTDRQDNMKISYGNETWQYDSVEEFFAEYPKAESYEFNHSIDNGSTCYVNGNLSRVWISVILPSRADIQAIFNIFEKNADKSALKVDSKPIKVFIGHGHDPQWRDLKDHLQDQHGLEVTAYEVGPRAGLTIKEVLEGMLNESSIAFLVLTGEDITTDGEVHARENVIHEVGLFQGRLGFKRAIILLEKGCHEFSNINGINQIRFSKGNIKEVYGDVLATIRREFEQQKD